MVSTRRSSCIASEAPLLALRDVTKSYAGVRVLQIDNLAIYTADRISLLGPNASGKSTLLRLLAGIARPSSGRVVRSRTMKGLRVCYLPESGGFSPDLTVVQHLRAVARLYDMPRGLSSAAQEIIARFRLEPFLDAPIRNLSSGFQKIAGLTATLGVAPDVLYLDEPFNGLDDDHAILFEKVIDAFSARMKLLVITGHDGKKQLSWTRSVNLKGGKIQ